MGQASLRAPVWRFAETCSRARTPGEVADAFATETRRLGFAHVALCSHVDPLNPPPGAVAVIRYPADWIVHFSENRYDRIDPVFAEASRRSDPFAWSDPGFLSRLDDDQMRVLREGAEAGVADGFTFPIKIPGALDASCSLVAGDGGADPDNLAVANAISVFAHETTRRMTGGGKGRTARLSDRERECLAFVARGKSDWVISQFLGVSERAVHHAVERAKKRLGVSTRVQAVVCALLSGQISPSDVAE